MTISSLDIQDTLDCAGDSLKVFDADRVTASPLETLCGKRESPMKVRSTRTNMYIVFSTDPSFVSAGFRASYVSIPTPNPSKEQYNVDLLMFFKG